MKDRINIKKKYYFDDIEHLKKNHTNLKITNINNYYHNFIYKNLFFINYNKNIMKFPDIFIKHNHYYLHYSLFIYRYEYLRKNLMDLLSSNHFEYKKLQTIYFDSYYYKYFFNVDINIYKKLPCIYNNNNIIYSNYLKKNLTINKNNNSLIYLIKKIKKTQLINEFIKEYDFFYNNFIIIQNLSLIYTLLINKNISNINIIDYIF